MGAESRIRPSALSGLRPAGMLVTGSLRGAARGAVTRNGPGSLLARCAGWLRGGSTVPLGRGRLWWSCGCRDIAAFEAGQG